MGNGQTSRQGGAQQARPSQTAQAAEARSSAGRGRQAGLAANCSLSGHVGNGVHVISAVSFPTTQRELTLARGPLQLLGAQGVRNPGQRGADQGGVTAGVWLCQPTGGGNPGLCLTDGRAEPARTGTKRVPPVWAGRLVPRANSRDDWRGDARGRNHRRSGAQLDRSACTRGEAGTRQYASRADGARRPSLDTLQMAVLTRISGVQLASSGASALPEMAPRAAWAGRDLLSSSVSCSRCTSRTDRSASGFALPVLNVTSTLHASCSDDSERRVVHHGRVSVPHPFGRAGRLAANQEHHHGEPGTSGGPWPRDQSSDCAPTGRAAPVGAVRHTREGLADWRVRRVPHASRRHADHPGSWDTGRVASRRGCEALDERAVQSAEPCKCHLRRAAGRRAVERDPGQHPWLRGGWTRRVPSPSLLQHLEVVAGAGSRGPARSASTRRSSAWWAETGAAPLTVRTLVRRIMPVFDIRSVPVSMAVGRSERTGVRP